MSDLSANLKAAFIQDHILGDAPLTVQFTDQSTGTITSRVWSFGDGQTSHDKSPSHVYENPGDYLASLTVFNSEDSSIVTQAIDVTAPDTGEVTNPQTVLDLIPSIRAGMRRPSEAKLRYRDIQEVINDLLMGYSRDLNLSIQDHRTDEVQCTISPLGGADYLLTVPGAPEVDAKQLKFISQNEAQQTNIAHGWREVSIVPLDYYAERHLLESALCSFYAGMLVDDGVKVKMNISPDTVAQSIFKLRYQVPILKVLTLASRVPLPSDLIPMIKVEARLACLQYVRDDSTEFLAWRKVNEPMMIQQVKDWRDRWDDFLNSSTEPDNVRKTPANAYRLRNRRPNYHIERGS
jgi:PKD repeat protein